MPSIFAYIFCFLSIKSPSELQVTLSFMLYFSVFNQTPQTHASNLPASVRMSGVCLFVNVYTFVVASVCRLSRVRRVTCTFLSFSAFRAKHESFIRPRSRFDLITAPQRLNWFLAAWLPWCPSDPPLVRFSRVERVLLILFDPTG